MGNVRPREVSRDRKRVVNGSADAEAFGRKGETCGARLVEKLRV